MAHSLERSPQYLKSLKEIRQSPTTTPEEVEHKQEEAKLFRMEVMFDNAQCAQITTQAFEANPKISVWELTQTIRKTSKVFHASATDRFVKNLLESRERVGKTIDILRERSHKSQAGIAKELYRAALRQPDEPNSEPEGTITYDQTYPLAVILYVEDEKDFARIHDRTNVGGFMASNRSHKDSSTGETINFPLLAIQGVATPTPAITRILSHEKGHAETNILVKSVDQKQRKVVWEQLQIANYTQVKDKLQKQWEADPEQAKSSPEWKKLMDYSLGWAKDEILAEYKAFPGNVAHHVQTLQRQQYNYDYFGRSLKIDPQSSLYTALWQEYKQKMDTNFGTARDVAQAYRRFNLQQRTELFRWVLAQIPLDQWHDQLTRTLFVEEAQLLQEVAHLPDTALQDELGLPSPRKIKARDDLLEILTLKQTEPLLPYLRDFKSLMEQLTTDDEENRFSVLLQMENTSNQFMDEVTTGGARLLDKELDLIRLYRTLCDQYQLTRDPNYLNSFLRERGWRQ